MIKITFEVESGNDLDTLIEVIHNVILDLEDNGDDQNPEAKILRNFVSQIERR